MYNQALSFPGYDQNAWVASQHYSDLPWEDLVRFWCAYNHHLWFVRNALEAAMEDRMIPFNPAEQVKARKLRSHAQKKSPNLLAQVGLF